MQPTVSLSCVLHSYNRQSHRTRINSKTSVTRSSGATRHSRYDAWLEAKSRDDYPACSQPAEAQAPFLFSSGGALSSRLRGRIVMHHINKSLFLNVCTSTRLEFSAKSSAFPLQLSLRARFCILPSGQLDLSRQNSWSSSGRMETVSMKETTVARQLCAKCEYIMAR